MYPSYLIRKFRPFARRIPAWAYLLLTIVLVVNIFYILARFRIPVDGIGTKESNNQCIVTAIREGSASMIAGIKLGDILQSIGNQEINANDHLGSLNHYRAGDVIEYRVLRGEEQRTFSVKLSSFWDQHAWFYFTLYFIIFFLSLTSLFILYKKPFDPSARVFVIFLFLFAISQNTRFLFGDEFFISIANFFFILSFNVFGITLLHFFLLFPKPISHFKLITPVLKIIYGIGITTGILLSVLLIRSNLNLDTLSGHYFDIFRRWSILWMGITLILALLIAFIKLIITREVNARKQLRLVALGSVFGLLSPIIFSINPSFIWQLEIERHFLTSLEFSNAAGSIIMIICIGIAIFKYKIWEIELFLKKAILYTSATVITLMIYLILVYLIDLLAIRQTPPMHLTILAFSVFSFLFLRDILQRAIDRIFHQESYDSATVVAQFEEKLAGMYQIDILKVQICKCLEDIFHPEFILLARKYKGLNFEVLHLEGKANTLPDPILEINDETLRYLHKGKVISVDEVFKLPEQLEKLGGDLIVPIIQNNQVEGFIQTGHKVSGKSFSLQDIRVLSLVARRIITLFHTAALYAKDVERQIMLESERRRIAEDMHDELGVSLTRISILSELSRAKVNEPENIEPWLLQISNTANRVIEEMNQVIWVLNPKNDTLTGLLAYLRRFVSELFESSQIHCEINFPEIQNDIGLSGEFRRNIYLVVREASHNIVKHSGASMVNISMVASDSGFDITVCDNGNGFNTEDNLNNGNGMINMKKRMERIGGSVTIKSRQVQGTEVILKVNTDIAS